LLNIGILHALDHVLGIYGAYRFEAKEQQVADSGSSRVDYVLDVNYEDRGLLEVKSPSFMNHVGGSLPQTGIKLTWVPGQCLGPRVLTEVSTLFSSPTTLAFKKHV
jgi:hypothetical protein